jgi:hypothetical protein
MLLVIFGAGASYDSKSSFTPAEFPRRSLEYRPPLANELFLKINQFRNHINTFPQCRPLVTYLEPHGETGVSIEEELGRMQSEAERDPERLRQLAAVRYYLRNLIQECQQQWTGFAGGTSNYHTLWDQLRRATPVLAVTFNYDTLFEDALAGTKIFFRQMSDYINISSVCSLIKPHGSINWETLVGRVDVPSTGSTPYNENYLIDHAASLESTKLYRLVGDHTGDGPGRAWWPALAIPTVSKSTFTCPGDYLGAFRGLAPQVTKILIVGWRAAEQHFLKELADGVRTRVGVHVVCENETAANEVIARLKTAGIQGDFKADPSGFTGFVRSRRVEAFLDPSRNPI